MSSSSSTSSPCAACKFLRRKCTQECVFAPYFPPDNPQRFANVHKVFGASNVSKLLNELNATQREDAVNSLAYEAEARLNDPVYGCVGVISILQHRLKQMHADLNNARKELAAYIGHEAAIVGYAPQQQPSSSGVMPYNMQAMLGLPSGGRGYVFREPPQLQYQQLIAAQQMAQAQAQAQAHAAALREQMLRTYEENQRVAELQGFNGGFPVSSEDLSPSLALGSYDNIPYHHPQQVQQQQQTESSSQQDPNPNPHSYHQHQLQLQLQPQILMQQQQQQQQQMQHLRQQQSLQEEHEQEQEQQRAGSDLEGRSQAGPSC